MNLHLQARALLMPVIRQKFEKYDREGQKVDIAANLRGRRTNLLLLGFFFLSALHDAYRVTKGGKSRPM